MKDRQARICVYCGSASGSSSEYVRSARDFGQQMAAAGIGMVYGGANIGVMGALADAVLDNGGEAIGVIPKFLADKEIMHTGLSGLIEVDTMHQRKAKMAELSDGFVALPGGLGTLEEILEIITWAQLKLHSKPCGFLNTNHYYDNLLSFLHHAVGEHFVKTKHVRRILVEHCPENLLAQFLGQIGRNG